MAFLPHIAPLERCVRLGRTGLRSLATKPGLVAGSDQAPLCHSSVALMAFLSQIAPLERCVRREPEHRRSSAVAADLPHMPASPAVPARITRHDWALRGRWREFSGWEEGGEKMDKFVEDRPPPSCRSYEGCSFEEGLRSWGCDTNQPSAEFPE